MSKVLTTYSAKDLSGSLQHPYIPLGIDLSGMSERGIAQWGVRMSVNQSVLQVAADGAVIPSVVPGDMGEIELQVWQTSTIHQQLLALYNAIKAARDQGDVSQWFGATVLLQNIVDGSSHYGTGVAPTKAPDKTYADQAGRITWVLVCCNLVQQ